MLNILKNVKTLLSKKILEFPTVRQSTSYSCGAAAVQSILMYYGINVKEKDLMKKLKTNSFDGTDVKNILEFFKQLNFKATLKSEMKIDDLKNFINKEIPIIVLIQAHADSPNEYKENLDNGHYVVCIGYDEINIYFEDPSSFQTTYLKYEEFETRWKDLSAKNKMFIKSGIVIEPINELNFQFKNKIIKLK